MQRSVHWPTNGSGSSIAVGKIASHTTRKSIWKRFDARTRLFWSSWIKLLLRSLTVCMKKNQKHLTDQLRSLRSLAVVPAAVVAGGSVLWLKSGLPYEWRLAIVTDGSRRRRAAFAAQSPHVLIRLIVPDIQERLVEDIAP